MPLSPIKPKPRTSALISRDGRSTWWSCAASTMTRSSIFRSLRGTPPSTSGAEGAWRPLSLHLYQSTLRAHAQHAPPLPPRVALPCLVARCVQGGWDGGMGVRQCGRAWVLVLCQSCLGVGLCLRCCEALGIFALQPPHLDLSPQGSSSDLQYNQVYRVHAFRWQRVERLEDGHVQGDACRAQRQVRLALELRTTHRRVRPQNPLHPSRRGSPPPWRAGGVRPPP